MATAEAIKVCEAHYPKCDRCPIHAPCTAPHQWSYAGLEQHERRVNQAAIKWLNS